MAHSRPLFVYFRLFKFKYKLIKSVDGVLGSQTWDGRIKGADKSTELWRHPTSNSRL